MKSSLYTFTSENRLYLKQSLKIYQFSLVHNHIVVEPSSYPNITDLEAWMRIVSFLILLQPSVIN